MIDKYVGLAITITLIAMILWVASLFLPFFGFIHKRFKGLLVGCIVQPILLVIICIVSIFVFLIYMGFDTKKYRQSAIVTICHLENDSTQKKTYMYIGSDDICFAESGNLEKDYNPIIYNINHDISLFDVIYRDSTTITIDDCYKVKFDLKNRRAVATKYEDTIEVASIDWEKVDAYFQNKKSK